MSAVEVVIVGQRGKYLRHEKTNEEEIKKFIDSGPST